MSGHRCHSHLSQLISGAPCQTVLNVGNSLCIREGMRWLTSRTYVSEAAPADQDFCQNFCLGRCQKKCQKMFQKKTQGVQKMFQKKCQKMFLENLTRQTRATVRLLASRKFRNKSWVCVLRCVLQSPRRVLRPPGASRKWIVGKTFSGKVRLGAPPP